MMKTMLMSAKIRFIKSDDTGGVSQCDVYIDRVNLLDQLLTNNCSYIPSVDQLTKPDTLRYIYHIHPANSLNSNFSLITVHIYRPSTS